jgi:uncharacterized membrane protein SpoIIM required for sporulation
MRPQDEFVAVRRNDWDELRELLDGGKPWRALRPATIARAAALYRAVCGDLVRAQSAGYAREVVGVLDDLAARAHNALYSAPPYRLGAIWELVARDFPRTLRRHVRFFALAVALFVLPGVLGFAGAFRSRAFALQVLSPATVAEMEKAYAKGFDKGRGEDVDTAMAGFYVYNNVGIAFRCFATGVLFGLGSAFFLVYNGLVTGAVAGLITVAGSGRNLFTFICTHSAFELTAVVIAGTAGMVMGYALVDTGGRTRFGSLREKSRDVARLVLGAALMLLVAAGIEGFWSPSGVGAHVKWITGGAAYLAVIAYLAGAGRKRSGASGT